MNLIKIAVAIVFILATLLTLRLAGVFSVVPTLFATPADNSSPKAMNPTLSQSTHAVEEVKPSNFELGNMIISPGAEVEVDRPVTIAVPVKNVGGEANSYVASLIVNDTTLSTRSIYLKPGESGNLSYELIKRSPGTYELQVGDLKETLRVFEIKRYTIPVPDASPSSDASYCVSPPCKPFIISRISFRYANPNLVKIVDSTNKEIFSTRVNSNKVNVPNIEVNDNFCIHLVTTMPLVESRQAGQPFGTSWGHYEYSVTIWPWISSVDGFQKCYDP